MLKLFSALKAFFVFIGRYAKWLSVILFGIVVAVVVSWLSTKGTLSDKEKEMLKTMPERLNKYREAYEKAIATAMKPKSADEIKSDFDSNFGGKP
jgi:membrane glycosyltransferase